MHAVRVRITIERSRIPRDVEPIRYFDTTNNRRHTIVVYIWLEPNLSMRLYSETSFFHCTFMKLIILYKNSIPSSFTLVFKINSEKHLYNESLRNTPMCPLILFQKFYNTI